MFRTCRVQPIIQFPVLHLLQPLCTFCASTILGYFFTLQPPSVWTSYLEAPCQNSSFLKGLERFSIRGRERGEERISFVAVTNGGNHFDCTAAVCKSFWKPSTLLSAVWLDWLTGCRVGSVTLIAGRAPFRRLIADASGIRSEPQPIAWGIGTGWDWGLSFTS